MFVQAFLLGPPVEALHPGIVGRRARQAEVELDAVLVCPPGRYQNGRCTRS